MLRAQSQKSVVLSSIVFESCSFSRLLLALHFHAIKWQLATSVQVRPYLRPATIFRSTIQSSPISLLFTSDVIHCPCISLFFSRRIALRFHALKWQLATSRPDLRSATTFRFTIPSSPISILFNSANLLSSSHELN